MSKHVNDSDMSSLEREFELEFDQDGGGEGDEGLEEEFREFAEFEMDEPEEEAGDYERSLSYDDDDYAERFYELSLRNYESEAEIDYELARVFEAMEQDFFFKGLGRKLNRAGKGLVKQSLQAAKKAAAKHPLVQTVKGVTQLARGNLKGTLGSLAKAGLKSALSAHPAGAAALPALQALGFEATEDPEDNRGAWDNFVRLSEAAYDQLAHNFDDRAANDPIAANELAKRAFQAAFKQATGRSTRSSHNHRIIRVKKGETITIEAE
jgi:hypothetical protein